MKDGDTDSEAPALVTGGAGFMGSNLTHAMAASGRRVIVLDDLSRPGSEKNLARLRAIHGRRVLHRKTDLRDTTGVAEAVAQAGAVFHLAGQVGVDASIRDPAHDFTTNVEGTFGILEALRQQADDVPIVFASTNKVYGQLAHIPLQETDQRVEPDDPDLRARGLDETTPLDFCSPYGCSKGAADQYVLDHARTYGLPALTFRMGCVYGPFQHGTEEQGWVAHFTRSAIEDRPITLFGDGRQVRDVLFAKDVVAAFLAAERQADKIKGRPFNIGGGPGHTLSLRELVVYLRKHEDDRPTVRSAPPRLGDQRYYVSDTSAFRAATGWKPTVDVPSGLMALTAWLRDGTVPDSEQYARDMETAIAIVEEV